MDTDSRRSKVGIVDRLFVSLVIGHWVLLSILLWTRSPEWSYPFMGGDGFDYFCNGFFYRGFDVPYSVRPPVLPLLIAGLDWAGLLSTLPALVLALHHLAVLALYRLLLFERLPNGLAPLMATGFLVSDSSVYYGSTLEGVALGSSLLFLAFFSYAGKRPVLAGVLAGASFASHQLALLFPIAVLGFELLRPTNSREANLRGRQSETLSRIGSVAVGFAPFAIGYWLLRMTTLGTVGDGSLRHWSLLAFHLDGIATYLIFVLSIAGVPLALLAAAGVIRLLKGGNRWTLTVVLPALILIFFAVLYDYNSRRFVSYLTPFLFLLASLALRDLSSRLVLLPAAFAVLAAATPTSVGSEHKVTVAVLPGVVADLPIARDTTGSATVQLGNTTRFRRPNRSVYARAYQHWTTDPVPTLSLPGHPTLYLYPDGDAPPLYGLQTRLSARLRTTVKVAPISILRRLTPEDEVELLPPAPNLSVYRFDSSRLDDSWRLLVPENTTLDPRFQPFDGAEAGRATLDGPIAVLAEDGSEIPPELPFEIPPETIFSIAEGRSSTLDFLEDFECKPVALNGYKGARACQVFGRTWTVLDFHR